VVGKLLSYLKHVVHPKPKNRGWLTNDEKHMGASWHVALQRKDSRLQMNKAASLVGIFSCHS
jgi:hypothetical protein